MTAFIEAHLTAILASLSALAVAGICTMPALYPKSFQDAWTWMRDTLQTVVPAARAQRPEAHIVTSQESASGASSKSDATFQVAPANPTQAGTVPPPPKA